MDCESAQPEGRPDTASPGNFAFFPLSFALCPLHFVSPCPWTKCRGQDAEDKVGDKRRDTISKIHAHNALLARRASRRLWALIGGRSRGRSRRAAVKQTGVNGEAGERLIKGNVRKPVRINWVPASQSRRGLDCVIAVDRAGQTRRELAVSASHCRLQPNW